jgi:tape measure domain-containing protein
MAAQELARQMSQVDQAGVAYTQDLNILQDQGVPIFKAIAKELNTNVAAVRKMASNGQISADIYNKAFNSIADTVKGSADKQSQTFTGMLSTLKDDFGILSGVLAKPIFDKLHEGLQKLLPLMDGLTSLAKGDFKGFQDTLEKAFGKGTGDAIASFTVNIKKGMDTVKQYLDKGKQALQALFDFVKGDDLGGMSILKKLGLSTDQIVLVTKTLDGIKQEVKGYINAISSLFKGKNNIQSSFVSIFDTAYKIVKPILLDMVSFFQKQFSQIKTFWDQNGAQIVQAVKNFVAIVAAIFKDFAPAISDLLKSTWNNIKIIFSGAINIIEGVLKVFAGLFTGDWKKMWEGIKQIISSAFGIIKGVFNNDFSSLKKIASDIWSGIIKVFHLDDAINNIKSGIDKIKSFFANLVTHIPMPHFNISMGSTNIGGVKVPTPNIGVKWYDTGGIFYGPQVIGVGEKRPEFVGALDDLRKIIREESGNTNAQLVNAMMQTQRQQTTGRDVVFQIDGRVCARLLKPHIDAENLRVGTQIRLQTI